MKKISPLGLCVFVMAVLARAAVAQDDAMRQLPCDLGPLLEIPGIWALTPEKLEQLFPKPQGASANPYFMWLTADHSRAQFIRDHYSNLRINMTILDKAVPVEEAIVDFTNGKLNGVTFSIYNRGDSGNGAKEDVPRRVAKCNEALRQKLGVVPTPRHPDPAQGLLAAGWTWISPLGMASLEYNPELERGRPEYLRLRIAPRDARGAIAAAMREQRSGTTLTELAAAVKRSPEGDVWIDGVPMVDQGPKGYCVVASAQRLFEYYGVSCDEHQLAQMAGTQAQGGTSSAEMTKTLQSLDTYFKMHYKGLLALYTDGRLRNPTTQKTSDERDFQKQVQDYVNKGIPLLWGLDLGKYPEEPPIKVQTVGGHMRLIIGYNSRSGDVIFTDSWGAGHEMKRMKIADAFHATHGLYVMQPTTH
jgi:hypothetical protein